MIGNLHDGHTGRRGSPTHTVGRTAKHVPAREPHLPAPPPTKPRFTFRQADDYVGGMAPRAIKTPRARAPKRRSHELGIAREKERMAWELFVNGATYQQIADTNHPDTGDRLYPDASNARDAVHRAMAYRASDEEVEAVRAQRLAGLQAQRLDCVRQLQRVQGLYDQKGSPVMVQRKKPDGTTETVQAEDQRVRMQIHRTLTMIDQRIAALTGTDAATRHEIVPAAPPQVLEERKAELLARANSIRLRETPAIEAVTRESTREAG